MSYAFLQIIEALQSANSPADTKWALALADKLLSMTTSVPSLRKS
jgi:hypothetical protein